MHSALVFNLGWALEQKIESWPYLSIGCKITGRNLQRHSELSLFAHLLTEEVGLPHEGVCLDHVLS